MPLDYDVETTFPGFFADVMEGRALCASAGQVMAAQDRVVMRRFIRKHYPSLGVAVRDMGTNELTELVRDIQDIQGA